MDWKEFFRPTKEKIFLAFGLFLLTSYRNYIMLLSLFAIGGTGILADTSVGFPLKYSTLGASGQLDFVNLIVNLLFWYAVSVVVIYLYKNSKTNKK